MRKNENDETTKTIRTNRHSNIDILNNDTEDIRYYGVVYSKARSGFKTKQVKSSSTEQLDINKYEIDTNEDFTTIKQLLVDITEQDNNEWMKITESGIGTSFQDFKTNSKRYRFENAFNNFFDNIKFKGIDNSDADEKKILFEKNNHSIYIDDLSTGEKQIVFRGAHLLRNMNGISGGIVLIDEPELSMHPMWQNKILSYYRNIFNKNGIQDVQIIIATHSEYVIRAGLQDQNNVLIITLKDDNGTIVPQKITAPVVLPTITAAETNYIAFGILSPDFHIQLYGYLQNKTGNDTVKSCDDYIMNQIGYYNPTIHAKQSTYTNRNGHTTIYHTLPTYIRNLIDHPDSSRSYTQEELKCSIELLINLCR